MTELGVKGKCQPREKRAKSVVRWLSQIKLGSLENCCGSSRPSPKAHVSSWWWCWEVKTLLEVSTVPFKVTVSSFL